MKEKKHCVRGQKYHLGQDVKLHLKLCIDLGLPVFFFNRVCSLKKGTVTV